MAEYDGLYKSTDGAADMTVQTAGSIPAAARLNDQINAEEKKIEAACLSIGKQYIELHSDDYEEAFAESMALVSESNDKITRFKWQLLVLNGINICISCGKEVPAGSAFCNHCGVKLPVIEVEVSEDPETPTGEPVNDMISDAIPEEAGIPPVQSVDNVIPEEPRTLPFSMTDDAISEEPVTPPAAPVDNAVPSEPAEPAGLICPVCGGMLEPDARFCILCGTPVTNQPAPQKPAEPAEHVCPVCGEMLEPGARFCISCGTPVANQPVPQKPAEPTERVCPFCGEKLDPKALFCTECGRKL